MILENNRTKKVGVMARIMNNISRMNLALLPLLIVLLVVMSPSVSKAQSTPPPAPVADPFDEPYAYDLQTAIQIDYWSTITDNMAKKFDDYVDDSEEIADSGKVWDVIEEHNIHITRQEAKILCLFMDEAGDAPPADLITGFPAWPNCGGILQTIFGAQFVDMINNASDEDELHYVLNNHRHVLGSMGIRAYDVKETMIGQGAADAGEHTEADRGEGENCKDAATNIKPYEIAGCGILCTVTKVIMGLLHTASTAMMSAIADNAKFQTAVMAALILYTVIYGAMVVLGFVQVALGDAVVRVAKLGIVAMLLTSETAMLFFNLLRCFFIEGTTYLIQQVLAIGTQAVNSLGGVDRTVLMDFSYSGNADSICSSSFDPDNMGPGPLSALEALITQLFSPHMFLVLITMMGANIPFGFIMALFLIFGIYLLVAALIYAVTIYLTALIAQYLLLSLLPVFMAFLLFDRTKYLFEGWINQLVSYSLSPILLFAYLSLFILIMEAAIAQILDVRICWAKVFTIAWVFDVNFWQFVGENEVPTTTMPFGFFEVLVVILLAYLMKEFFGSVEDIARDIGNSYVYVSKAAQQLQGWFRGKKQTVKAKGVDQASRFARGGLNKAAGFTLGSRTDSASGQRGVRGPGGASNNSGGGGGMTRRGGPK